MPLWFLFCPALPSCWAGPRLLLLAEVSTINSQLNPAWAGWREAEEGDSQEIGVPLSVSADLWPRALSSGSLASSSPGGGC